MLGGGCLHKDGAATHWRPHVLYSWQGRVGGGGDPGAPLGTGTKKPTFSRAGLLWKVPLVTLAPSGRVTSDQL